MTAHIMLDIETLSTRADATVLTIGACLFDPTDPNIVLDSVHIQIDKDHPDNPERHICPNTLKWWEKQADEAKESLVGGTLSLKEALEKLTEYCVKWRATDTHQKASIWANDPDFDITILTSAYTAAGLATPWQFWESRSMRTVKMLGEDFLGINLKNQYPRHGTHHNAEDDAKHQAWVVADLLCRAALATGKPSGVEAPLSDINVFLLEKNSLTISTKNSEGEITPLYYYTEANKKVAPYAAALLSRELGKPLL